MHLIYRITNLLNGKTYIGQHTYHENNPNMGSYYGGGIEIKRAVRKYGRENFKREILYSRIRDQETADAMEIWAIEKYKPEYNIAKGGLGKGCTDKTKVKISNTLKHYFAENGCHNKGRKHSQAYKDRCSLSSKKRFSDPNERKRTSELTKKAMEDPKIRKKLSEGLKEYYRSSGKKPITTLGKRWYNNGEKSGFFIEGTQPDGWVLGRIYQRRK